MLSAHASTDGDVAVILLVHPGTVAFIKDCAASLMCQTFPLPAGRLLVVLNGADAEVRGAMHEHLPTARWVELPRNVGWAAGNNAAIRLALAEGAQMVVLVNVDTVLDTQWLERLVAGAAAHPDRHILQSKILLHGTDRLNSLGNRIHYLGYGYCQGHGQQEARVQPERLDFASGAAMLVKREVFDAVGLFREEYFLYGEDLEFCWRAQLAGLNIGLIEDSICHHRYRFRRLPEQLYYRERNRLMTLLTLSRLRTLLVLAPCLLVAQVSVCGYGLAMGWGGGVWRLIRHFSHPKTWQAVRRTRQQICALRVRSDAEIIGHFAGAIKFPDFGGGVLRYVLNPCMQAYWWLVRGLIVW